MSEKKTACRRILREFKIDEISAVDRPAQGHARMVLMKRREPGRPDEDETSFQTRVSEIAKRDDCTRLEAMRKAREENPALYHFLNGNEVPDEAFEKAHPKDTAEWNNKVEGIKQSEGCSGTEAARLARCRYPELHAAMQRGDPGVTKDLAMPSKEIIGGETAKMEWNQAVARIQNRDDGSWMTASRKARIEHPDLFAAYQRVGGAM